MAYVGCKCVLCCVISFAYAPAGGDEVYDDFTASFGRRHSSREEYEHRRGVFHDNRRFIEDWNAQAPNSDSHMLGLNHFADWTQVARCMHANHILFIELLALSTCWSVC